MDKNEEVFLAALNDKNKQAKARNCITHSAFLDATERNFAERAAIEKKAVFSFDGGYPDAERCLIFFYPDLASKEEGTDDSPFRVLRVKTKRGAKPLTHRDYLGSLMALGIDRSLTGDILVGEAGREGQKTDIIVLSEMAEYIAREYTSVGRETIETEILPLSGLNLAESAGEEIKDTVASLRLDAVVGSAFHLSRGDAQEAIRRGLVFLNSRETAKADKTVEEGDKITLRGKGKAVITEIGQRTKKDRVFLTMTRYK